MRKNKCISKLNEKQSNHIPLNSSSKNNINNFKETISNSFIQGIGFGTAIETVKNISSSFQSSNTSNTSNTSTFDHNKKIINDYNMNKDMNKDNLEDIKYDFTCSDIQEKTFKCVNNNYNNRDVCKEIIDEYNKCIRNIYNP